MAALRAGSPKQRHQHSILRSFLQRCGRNRLGAMPAASTTRFRSLDGAVHQLCTSACLFASVLQPLAPLPPPRAWYRKFLLDA